MAIKIAGTYIEFDEEASSPSNPSAGKRRLFFDSTGSLRVIDNSGANSSAGVDALDDVGDVDTAGVNNGDTLIYNSVSGNWEAGVSSTVAAINDLTDVNISTPTNGQFLSYLNGTWSNYDPFVNIENVNGINVSNIEAGQILYNETGSDFENRFASKYSYSQVSSFDALFIPSGDSVKLPIGQNATTHLWPKTALSEDDVVRNNNWVVPMQTFESPGVYIIIGNIVVDGTGYQGATGDVEFEIGVYASSDNSGPNVNTSFHWPYELGGVTLGIDEKRFNFVQAISSTPNAGGPEYPEGQLAAIRCVNNTNGAISLYYTLTMFRLDAGFPFV